LNPGGSAAHRLTIAVTGAGGYVGSRLVSVLAARPDTTVRALIRRPAPVPEGAEVVTGDLLRDDGALDRLCVGADVVVHLAGPNEVEAERDPERAVAEVVSGTLRLAEAISRSGVRRAIYVSTVHVYGARMRPGVAVDEDTPCEPRSPYAVARLAAEHLLASQSGAPLVVLRLTNAVGAPAATTIERWSLVANDLCRQGATTGRLVLRTHGAQSRDFVALRDVGEIVARLCVPLSIEAGTYNLGSGAPMSVRSLAGMVQDAFADLTGCRPDLEAPPAPPGMPPAAPLVSTARLSAAGFSATTPLREAVTETARFCLDHRAELVPHHNERP
jgi:UDP-glucose 4-epimerase